MDVAFTDSSLDLQGVGPAHPAGLAEVEDGLRRRASRGSHQVHGDDVVHGRRSPGRTASPPATRW